MKTHSLLYRTLPVCALLLGMVASLPADDGRIRIRIPNPIPRIVNKINQVGDFIARKAERIEIVEVEEHGSRRPLPPAPPPGSYIITTETTTQVPVDPRYRETARDPLVDDTTRYLIPPSTPQPPPSPPIPVSPLPPVRGALSTAPSGSPTLYSPPVVRPSPGVTALPAREPALTQPHSPSVPAPAPRSVLPPMSAQPAGTATADAPAPPPLPPFGKPVPGRPGLVYPPGIKESPENMIDVREIAPGTKVRDPLSKTVFRVP